MSDGKDSILWYDKYKDGSSDVSLLETMWKYNKKIRKVHDWQEIPFAVEGNHRKK